MPSRRHAIGAPCFLSRQEITLSYLKLGLVAERYALYADYGARHKAATLLRDCRAISGSRTSHHDALRQFMRRLDLFLSNPPPSAPTYALIVLAVAGVPQSPELEQLRQALHNSMVTAVADAASAFQDSDADTIPAVVKKVEDLAFRGVSASAFGDAIEAKTPYARNSSVLEPSHLKPALQSVWKHMAVPDLFLWTSWDVLEQVAQLVEPSLAGSPGSAAGQAFTFFCLRMVAHVMEPALAALVHLVSDRERSEISGMTNAIATCLGKKRRWLSAFSTPPPLVAVGMPPYADSVKLLDAFYASFPTPSGSFFEDWLATTDAWRQRVSPHDVHFDPLDGDVEVAVDGTVLVPVPLLAVPFYASDRPAAANLGGLGHLIARRLVTRYLRAAVTDASTVPAGCLPPLGSPTDGLFENLLAYDCVSAVFHATNSSGDPRLPRMPSLNPDRMVYTAGCLTDCAVAQWRTCELSCSLAVTGVVLRGLLVRVGATAMFALLSRRVALAVSEPHDDVGQRWREQTTTIFVTLKIISHKL
ncbi:hypothetical protein MTO96_007515 [Rhipicephalus appendiculatus]